MFSISIRSDNRDDFENENFHFFCEIYDINYNLSTLRTP